MLISPRSARDSSTASKDPSRAAARTILPRIAGETLCESSRKLGRRGEKIPATGRAVTDGFVVLTRPAANLNGSWRLGHRTGPCTRRTRLVIAEALELGSEDFLDGPPADGLPHVNSQRFDGIEIEVEPRSFLPIGTPGNDFAPSIRHVAKVGRIVGLTLGERHALFILELRERGKLGKST